MASRAVDRRAVPTSPERPLLTRRATLPAVLLAVLSAAVCAVLGYRYADNSGAGRLDTTVDVRVRQGLAAYRSSMAALAHLGDPWVVIALTTGLALACLWFGLRRAALLAAVSIPLSGGAVELVLKPLVHRTVAHPHAPTRIRRPRLHVAAGHEPSFTFPSGHTVGAFALATCVLLILLGCRRAGPLRVLLHSAAAVVTIGLAVGVAVAVVALRRHYATDAVGGAAVAVAVVLIAAVAIDAVAGIRAGRKVGGLADVTGE